MREPVYLVLTDGEYETIMSCCSLASAREGAADYARGNPGVTYVIATIVQAVTAEIATRWDE